MVTHKLLLDVDTDEQDVLCVHTVLPSYLFVFYVNRLLGLSLVRSKQDLQLRPKPFSFAVYEYDCAMMQQSWRIVENQMVSKQKNVENSLFVETEERVFLFPQLEQIDLLVCVNGLTDSAVKKIQSIGRVISCYRLPKHLNNIREQLTF